MRSVVSGALMMAFANTALGQTFARVPFVPGRAGNEVRQISSDGVTVVGTSGVASDLRVTKWTVGGALEIVSTPSGYDGTFRPAVGATANEFAHGSFELTRFTRVATQRTGGQTTIINGFQLVNAISGDGSTIVGFDGSSNATALRWTASGGVQNFGTLQGVIVSGPGTTNSVANAFAANGDGSVIVGAAVVQIDRQTPVPTIIGTPFIWTASGGARTIPLASGQLLSGIALDVTSDGTWVCGIERQNFGFFRWSAATGYQFFPGTFNGTNGESARMSDDGNAIIAYGTNYWSPGTGVISLTQLLTQAGCNFTGWTNLSAIDISGDGLTIAGNGTNPLGQAQGWVATVPGPGVGVMMVGAGAMVGVRRRR